MDPHRRAAGVKWFHALGQQSGQKARQHIAAAFAADHGVYLIRKGHRTVAAAPDGRLAVNTTGNDGMAKGGSGDVLTGLIAALLCQGANARDAAALGVWLHGRAGELLEEEMTAYCASPLALVERGLPRAFRELC